MKHFNYKPLKAKNLLVMNMINNGWTLKRGINGCTIMDGKNHYICSIRKESNYFDTLVFTFVIGAKEDGSIYDFDRVSMLLAKNFYPNLDYKVNVIIA